MRYGYDGTTIGALAESLGISKAAITYYFPAKEAFLAELLESVLDELEAAVASSGSRSWPDGARTLFLAYLDVLVEHRDLALWLDTDPALRGLVNYGGRLRSLDLTLARRLSHPSRRRADRIRALAAVGGLWRPLFYESARSMQAHRLELVDAALVSFAPLPADDSKH